MTPSLFLPAILFALVTRWVPFTGNIQGQQIHSGMLSVPRPFKWLIPLFSQNPYVAFRVTTSLPFRVGIRHKDGKTYVTEKLFCPRPFMTGPGFVAGTWDGSLTYFAVDEAENELPISWYRLGKTRDMPSTPDYVWV